MIGNIYRASDIERPFIIGLPRDELLGRTQEAVPRLQVSTLIEGEMYAVDVRLPFNSGANGTVSRAKGPFRASVILDNIFVADPRLIGTGTGTRLVCAFLATALEVDSTQTRLRTSWVRLGAANAIIKACGPERVRLECGHSPEHWYGWETDRSLEQMFDDFPPVEDKAYQIMATTSDLSGLTVDALIDRI
jgi:hypothetical protein